MPIKRSGGQINLKSAFAMPVQPLGEPELAIVQLAIGEIAPDWAVELQGVCADEAILVLLPEGGDDAMGPSFSVGRENYGFRLDQLHWDTLTEVGVFASLDEVLDALFIRLAFCSSSAMPNSVTLH